MIQRILTRGELPLAREAAQIQEPPVSRERGRQIMEATVDSICRQIEADYPQLAEQGVNGWEEFKKAFAGQSQADTRARTSDGHGDSSDSGQGEGRTTKDRHGGNRRTTSPLDLIDKAFALVEECGGVEQLKRLVDRLADMRQE